MDKTAIVGRRRLAGARSKLRGMVGALSWVRLYVNLLPGVLSVSQEGATMCTAPQPSWLS